MITPDQSCKVSTLSEISSSPLSTFTCLSGVSHDYGSITSGSTSHTSY